MRAKRILVVSASMGGGHDGAAREMCRRLEARGHTTRMIDFLELPPLGIGTLVRLVYRFQLRFAPWWYELTYRMWYAVPALCNPLIALVTVLTGRRFVRLAETWRTDVIVSTYPLGSLALGRERERGALKVPVITYITDFCVHPLVTHPHVDLHVCVHPNSGRRAAEGCGRPVESPGPLVPPVFGQAGDREAARRRWGLAPAERAVLVVAGAWGVGDVEDTFELLAASGRYTPIALCGTNERLRQRLAARGTGRALGWTDEVPSLMRAADALVENAGGLSCMEAFAAGLPVVSFKPIPGHGHENAELMDAAGVSRYARADADLLDALDHLTVPGPERDAVVAAGRALFAGDAADSVCAVAGATPARLPEAAPAPARRGRLRTRVAAAAAAVAVAYGGLTVGTGLATAHGLGVARAPRSGDRERVYMAVRLDAAELASSQVEGILARMPATAVVDARTAQAGGPGLSQLARAGVDVANGGWGRGERLRWRRARRDVRGAGHVIGAPDRPPLSRFVPERRLDAFDLLLCRQAHQRCVFAHRLPGSAGAPAHLVEGGIYVVDGRAATTDQLVATLTGIERWLGQNHLASAPLSQLR
jgi:UDP-N-acetylglucosamine:LPS N-acetylglucosamine transferase